MATALPPASRVLITGPASSPESQPQEVQEEDMARSPTGSAVGGAVRGAWVCMQGQLDPPTDQQGCHGESEWNQIEVAYMR